MKVLHNLLLWSCDTFGDLFSGVVNRIAVTVVDTGFSSLLQKVLKEQPVDLSEGKKSINIRQTLEMMPNLCTISWNGAPANLFWLGKSVLGSMFPVYQLP